MEYFFNFLFRYWYLWITVAVLLTAALTGFNGSMEIVVYDWRVAMRIRHFLFGFSIFLMVTGLVYGWLDKNRLALAPWKKNLHLAVSVLFSIFVFIYLQVLEARRLNDPRRYFQVDQLRYWEDLNIAIVAFVVLFLVVQIFFLFHLFQIIRRRRASSRQIQRLAD